MTSQTTSCTQVNAKSSGQGYYLRKSQGRCHFELRVALDFQLRVRLSARFVFGRDKYPHSAGGN